VHVEANLRGGARQPTRVGVAGGNRDRGFGGRPEGDMLGGRAGQHHEPWGVGWSGRGGKTSRLAAVRRAPCGRHASLVSKFQIFKNLNCTQKPMTRTIVEYSILYTKDPNRDTIELDLTKKFRCQLGEKLGPCEQ
jgi:hypothetical protein